MTAAPSTKEVATFWHGPPLSALDTACLMTFVRRGFTVTVYGYDRLANLPGEIARGDAAAIVDPRFLTGFRFMGKPSLSHFSDLFRYNLFAKTGSAWIDADLLVLRDFSIPLAGNFLAKETPGGINGAIMRIDPADGRLNEVIRQSEGFATSSHFRWGATGPSLITRVFGPDVVAQASPIERFYAVGFEEWWKPFLPEWHDWCAERCARSDALHLWNNVVEKAGYWKDLAPPPGSYIHAVLSGYGLLDHFAGTYPTSVIEHLRTNYVNSLTGGNFKLTELSKMAGTRLGMVIRRKVFPGKRQAP